MSFVTQSLAIGSLGRNVTRAASSGRSHLSRLLTLLIDDYASEEDREHDGEEY